MVSFTFTIQCHLVRLASAHLLPSVWQSLVGLRLLISMCEAWQRSRTQNLRRVGKISGPILSRLWTEIYEILVNVGPLILSNILARLSIRY